MKILRIAILLLAGAASLCAQTTPNLHLNLPIFNAPLWNASLNANFSTLDNFLSGVTALPGLNVAGLTNVGVSGTGCTKAFTLTNTDTSPTNPIKTFRVNQTTGALEIVNSACTTVIFSLSDTGQLNGNQTIGGNLQVNGSSIFVGPFSEYNGIALAGNGIPSELNQVLATALAANYNTGTAKTLATPTAAGMWRISFSQGITQAATSTSTMPSLTLGYTDAGGIARTVTLVATSTSNATTVITTGTQVIYSVGGTAITITSASYASSGATPMQYALAVTIEQL